MKKIRPAIAASIGSDHANEAFNSAIGGPAWRPDSSVRWPVDNRGIIMMHLARINFAELPAFDGFPTSGLLQIFISTESVVLGVHEPHGKGFVIEYWPESKAGISVPQPELDEDNFEETPLMGGTPEDTLHDNGRSLQFTSVEMAEEEEVDRPEIRIGGWPLSIQCSEVQDGGIVLLQIGNGECGEENEFMWGGDIGAATFLISPEDLAERRFDKAHYDASGY